MPFLSAALLKMAPCEGALHPLNPQLLPARWQLSPAGDRNRGRLSPTPIIAHLKLTKQVYPYKLKLFVNNKKKQEKIMNIEH